MAVRNFPNGHETIIKLLAYRIVRDRKTPAPVEASTGRTIRSALQFLALERGLSFNTGVFPMMKPFLAATMLALSASIAFAADDLSTKEMKDNPGVSSGGSTATPTAKPNSGSLSERQMQHQPGVNSDKTGSTAMPNVKPADSSLSGAEMDQNPGARK
jgi:hypothetical protein